MGDNGLIIGVQGGNERSFGLLDKTLEKGIKVSGIWCQDWCGKRETSFGKRLQWDWKYHHGMYPDLPEKIKEVKQKNIRFLGYVNPYLVSDGWMADFGEYLPTDDIVLYNGKSPMIEHNHWPVLWAKCNYDAVTESGKLGEAVYFMRAGGAGSQKYCPLRWAEMAMFTLFMRTHEGNRPDTNFQYYEDEDTMERLARITDIYTMLAPYTKDMVRVNAQRGIPVWSMACSYAGDRC